MTAIWGPMGWMTLHSVSTSYPEVPNQSERVLMSQWLEYFRDTITCPSCREHFTEALAKYRREQPYMLESRQQFAIACFRLHNTVNARLSKPIYNSVEECMATLRGNIKNRTAQDYRISYVNHIMRYWRTQQDITGIVAMKKVLEMKKIEIEYIDSRDTKFSVTLTPDIVVTSSYVKPVQRINTDTIARPGFRLTASGFRIRK
jgi:hypothetical protein